jgi:hypothetical protein
VPAATRARRRPSSAAIRCATCRLRRERGEQLLGPSLGFEVIAWAQAYLVHGPGDVQGEPLELDDELGHFLVHAYELDEDGRRLVRRAYLSRPKGRAKTELAGIVAAAELLGPVRFDGWNGRGEPVGRPVRSPQVLCLATEEGQAGTTYSTAATMLGEGAAVDEYRLDIGLTRTYVAGGGVMLPDTSGASSADGARTTFANFDETHLWVTHELRRLAATVRRNLGKRRAAEPWSLETSTMYRPGEESVAEALFRTWEKIEAGELRDDGLLVDHRQAPDVELDDDDALESALRDVYGPAAEWLDFARIIAEMRDEQTDEADARRYWLNTPARGGHAWLDAHELADVQARAHELELEAGTPVVLGFDGSLSDDATALIGCTLARDAVPHLFVVGLFEPPDEPAGRAAWVVDREAVNAAVAAAFVELDVVLLFGDPAYWTPELAAWASTFGADVVREMPTSRDSRMGPATAALHTALVTGEATTTADPRYLRHLGNAHRRSTRYGPVLRKDRPSSSRKIDAAVASVLAFAARNDALAGNLDRRRRRRRRNGPGRLVTFE